VAAAYYGGLVCNTNEEHTSVMEPWRGNGVCAHWRYSYTSPLAWGNTGFSSLLPTISASTKTMAIK